MSAQQLVWLITGTTSGLGLELTLAALRRGDKVIATGRGKSLGKLAELQEKSAYILELDVTAPLETLQEVAKKAVGVYGRIDVLVNNAGYLAGGTLEETSPETTLDQFNTNVFGALNVTRAVLPYMREKRTGTIVFVGSVMGWQGVPYNGLYVSSKWALRGLSETLHAEISPLGLRSVCVDFGYFRTPVLEVERRTKPVGGLADYKEIVEKVENLIQATNGNQPGNPVKGVEAIIDIVKGEGLAAGKAFPLSVALGTDCYTTAKQSTEAALARLDEWKELSASTDF
ncbi:short chain dehydrogenase [Agrocybe pediades]|nr:short chain dehydrogenase [Agrocybe pediades]